MKLTRLELSGFKSFADTVNLSFEEGVTAIVGPNGCGKSNVSDAVRWVLGEQSARLLRGGKMEDVIFQGAATRRPVNVTEVSLYLDNSDGQLPTPYAEVVVTRRLSRSGQSDYLLNNAPVRLRDIHDLLRGTGLGSDAGVVIEAKMIDLLLSDRADERRLLFEEAAGIGLYRDRRHTTARRLEETAGDLQRLEDLIAEVQSQIRSLARQKGRTERHAALMEEKFAVTVTLASRHLERLAEDSDRFTRRHAELTALLPPAREALTAAGGTRDLAVTARNGAERHRATVAEDLAAARLAIGRLDGDIALATERLGNAADRRERAAAERSGFDLRLQQTRSELETADGELAVAGAELERIRQELSSRVEAEGAVRDRQTSERERARTTEQELQHRAEALRSLAGERAALEGELTSLRERSAQESTHRGQLEQDRRSSGEKLTEANAAAERQGTAARHGAAAAEQARLRWREARDREARELSERRSLEDDLARLTARRSALEALERDRVGLAPAAGALLAERARFGDRIVGPLSDFIASEGDQADLAERLLGEFVHAVLVRDEAAVATVRSWHAEAQPGELILLPVSPGPARTATGTSHQLRVDAVAAAWVDALTAGSETLDREGRAVRRADGAIYLRGPTAESGPIRRRAELKSLVRQLDASSAALAEAEARSTRTAAELAALEAEATATQQTAEQLREAERSANAVREDLARRVANLDRELAAADEQLTRFADRVQRAEARQSEVEGLLTEGTAHRTRLDEELLRIRATLSDLDAELERAREDRSQWQVQEAHLTARVRAATDAATRARQMIEEADQSGRARAAEIERLDLDRGELERQRSAWDAERSTQAERLHALETALAQAEDEFVAAEAGLATAEADLTASRDLVERMSEEFHHLELSVTEAGAQRRRVVERIETEWKRPFETLLETAPPLDLDLDTLESEAARIAAALESIGPVNALAVEEHAEESKRLGFLIAQRDDLVAARQSLLQAIREIDTTARALFLETFEAVQANFTRVFQTLFGGGECELRLTTPEDPIESEIEIHAAPRGKRTQRIHLLSSGERTLVAVSLLFSIYLTKPNPFCLMDEVDAPLDDANVGRFLRLLEEFKQQTQFLVITHNPRTMQAADTVYGVTMQEPGVSTIVGVRIGDQDAAA